MNVNIKTVYENDGGVLVACGYVVYDYNAEPDEREHYFATWEAVLAKMNEINEREPEDQ